MFLAFLTAHSLLTSNVSTVALQCHGVLPPLHWLLLSLMMYGAYVSKLIYILEYQQYLHSGISAIRSRFSFHIWLKNSLHISASFHFHTSCFFFSFLIFHFNSFCLFLRCRISVPSSHRPSISRTSTYVTSPLITR